MAEIYSLIAGILMILVMATYLYKVVTGISTPNTATWVIVLVVMTLNTLTYYTVVGGDLRKVGISVLATLGIIAIFTYSLFKGKFSRIGLIDGIVISLAFVVGFVWRTTGDAVLANLALQIVLLISFLPTARGLVRNEIRDHPLPWTLAVLSYCFQILTVLSGVKGWTWPELVFPILNGIFGNGTVLCIIIWKRRRGNWTSTASS